MQYHLSVLSKSFSKIIFFDSLLFQVYRLALTVKIVHIVGEEVSSGQVHDLTSRESSGQSRCMIRTLILANQRAFFCPSMYQIEQPPDWPLLLPVDAPCMNPQSLESRCSKVQ